jgi:copper chaperone NosL
MDPKFGGEIITKKGKAYKFDDMVCMINFLKSDQVKEVDISQRVVANFNKQNDFVDVDKVFFLVSPELKSPMAGNSAAFISGVEAEKIKTTTPGEIQRWKDLYEKTQ